MKQIKFLLVSLVLFLASCSKDDFSPAPVNKQDVPTSINENYSTESTQNPSFRVSEANNNAYIFVEPYSKFQMVAKYLNDSSGQTGTRKFLGFWVGNGSALQANFTLYMNMPHWTDGRLPSVYVAEIPQVSGGLDAHGNPKVAYNFSTVKIPKSVCGKSWISILIPVNAMANDTKRQRVVRTYEKLGNVLFTNGTRTFTDYTMNTVMFGYTFNYQGNVIPKGIYRLYTTYTNTGFRMMDNDITRDLYIRGSQN